MNFKKLFIKGKHIHLLQEKQIILLGSFTKRRKYKYNNCQDAMVICKRFGYPNLFVTITCNTNWPEIRELLSQSKLLATNIHNIVCKVFKIKLDHLMDDLRKNKVFGKLNANKCSVHIYFFLILF